ncbi:MAG: hypothetical protein EHM24_25385 [Acidobacteria bacterium]|nr:MAG: hypothetical protein EHM24_25385 [Acidobacteriota bacterium]
MTITDQYLGMVTGDVDELSAVEAFAAGPMEMRAAAADVSVAFAERLVTIVAVPYETPSPLYVRGEWITETVDRGAFRGVEHRARKVRVNRGHDEERTVGVARKLDPYDERGLMATLRISQGPTGDETLGLCADGALDASVGFAPAINGGEIWTENRTHRRIMRAFLGHIALVPNPVYDTANVLDVRAVAAPPAGPLPESDTPRLSEVLARLRALGYSPRP